MQKVMNFMRKNSGYVSIETVIVAGLIIGLGALSISSFQGSANGVTGKALAKVSSVQNNYDSLSAPQVPTN
jgi:F0F1-type ATP synthase membrane subunit c/vacuolar-type H+-ATPase subunit K